uniref:Putative netrin axonal chemotropic factor n=1 Tax=Panstrongylus lignarius TaxID=156445 RepID=A0A224X9G7_9HEMI
MDWKSPSRIPLLLICYTLARSFVTSEHTRYVEFRKPSCSEAACHPITGNLLIGRANRLAASSTCGLHEKQRYCIVSHLEEKKKCFNCDSRPGAVESLSHRIENVIHRDRLGSTEHTWWQSENGKEDVSISLNLEAEFHFTHLIMKFRTFRPAAMLVERSFDFGKTWSTYRYFAENCPASFPNVPTSNNLTDVFCESTYSQVFPVTGGEVILRIISPKNQTQPKNELVPEDLRNLMKMTNLRINFTKLHTLGDDLLDKREEIQEKYYYAVYEMNVRGACWCNGHADSCVPLDDSIRHVTDMVHGRCDCRHNTTGLNCQFCKDTHNDLPWKPAIGSRLNACKKCNCNNHAEHCNFSKEVYQESGHISGSVCIDCQHNTTGNTCEQCKPLFYHDPNRDLTDPYTCLSCNCNTDGTVDEGLCDPPTHSQHEGVCHCKQNVWGNHCNECKPGFWNLDANNPDGCQPCECDLRGTLNATCDQVTGRCTCKRNVLGTNCSECYPEHWGLSKDTDGCTPCGCDPGGSEDPNCDITGQCKCYPNLLGRTCSVPKQGFFVPDLDKVYEAEDASCYPNCQVEVREWPRVGKPTWTGRGYSRVYDNSQLEFTIDSLPTSSDFDLIVRYKVTNNEGVDAIATVQRPSSQPAGVCANSQDVDDTMYFQLQSGSLYSKAETPICLESGKPYKLILKFKSNSNQVDGPAASILIDSIALIPRPDSIDFFNRPPFGNDRITVYYDLECDEVFNGVQRPQIPEKCKKYHYSISVKLNQGARECFCNLTGSFSAFCEPAGGACTCKEKIVGRTCDHCAHGTWGFGPNGCTDCDCNSIGALNNLCDPYTGQCTCNNGIYGRSCDQCQPGSWKFPDCRPCQCHGHAHSCKDNGECIECRDFTTGHSCDRCSDGYYGDPTSLGTPCQPCRCPDTVESGHSFATTCKFNPETRDVTCVCKPGYTGPRCDVCVDNYYGNPEILGGSCRECDCSGNIDLSLAGNCDSSSGKCLQCLNHTTGFLCDECEAGYFGDPLVGDCKECKCDLLGTDTSGGSCDPVTGRCPCLPNVQGLHCNECVTDHWLIALGKGCIPCDCDPIGSKSTECNEFLGDCNCKDGFGGQKCNQCQKNFWGDPNEECYPCSCDLEGSVNGECHQSNGSCICREGVGGDKCDVCAVGHDGIAPECSSCGECFHSWNNILNDLSDTTRNSVRSAGEIMRTGSTGYNAAFDTLNKLIDNVNSTLTNTNKNTDHLDKLNSQVNIFRDDLSSSSESVKKFSSQVEDVISNISLANVLLETISERAQQLEVAAHNLSKAATHLQKQDRKGALNLTREAGEKSKNVSAMEKYVKDTVLSDADLQCRKTERFLNKEDSFTLAEENQDKKRSHLDFRLSRLEKGVPKLNDKICDKEGDPCDTLCGGAGCGKCGGSISCESGAVGKAAAALSIAVKYKDHIADSLKTADSAYRAIANASQMCENASESAGKVYAAAGQLKDKWEMSVNNLAKLNKDMDDFVKTSGTNSAEIRQVANETLSLNIQLKQEQITELARKINESIDSLKDVKTILNSTRNDQAIANDLKSKSDDAKKEAENVLTKAQNVLDGLKVADDAQQKAGKEIEMANNSITAIKQDLRQIESEMRNAAMKVNSTAEIVSGKIKNDMYRLRTVLFRDKDEGERIADVAKSVAEQVKNARNKVGQLDTQYGEVNMKLRQKETVTDSSKSRAQKLLRWAQHLSLNTSVLLKELKDADIMYNELDKKLTHISDEIDTLTTTVEMHIRNITAKSESYRDC